MRSKRHLQETESAVPANAAGAASNASGAGIDGIGVGPRGEPGVKKKKLRDIVVSSTPLSRLMSKTS